MHICWSIVSGLSSSPLTRHTTTAAKRHQRPSSDALSPTPQDACRAQSRCVSTHTPRLSQAKADATSTVGLAFVCVLVLAFLIGLSATIYYAWIQPFIARQRLRAQLRKRAKQQSPAISPFPNNDALNTPSPGSPSKDLEKGDESIFVKEMEMSVESIDGALPLPKPVFSFAKKEGRFSTSSRDGMWWFV